ncbi:MAG: VWA domain-containing protein [Bryobacteraceae bacterium]|jgi:VWFA-related protein
MKSPAVLLLAMLVGNGLAQAPDVVIRSSAREVLLDVVVRDAHGHLVTNLKPEDITVYEDGVRQDVRAFRLVAGSEVRIEDERQAAEAKADAAPPTAPAARPPLNPLRTVNVVCLVLNDITASDNDITGSSLVAPTRAFAFDAARKFIDNQLRPNTFIGIFTLDSSGLRPVYPFSNDRERLLKAAQLAAANQLPAITVGSAAILNGLSISLGVNGIGSTGDANDALGSRNDMRAAAIAGLREVDALKGLVRQLDPLPFQKTVLLLSNGLTRPPDQLEYWDSLIHAATDGGVTFYAVDVHALDPFYDPTAISSATLSYAASLSAQQGPTSLEHLMPPSGQIGNLGPPTLTTRTMELAHQDDYVKFGVSSANSQEAIRELAERTGGFLIANTNNVDHLLAHVMEEVDTHYEIAYPPKSERDDGHFRKIEVKLARTGLRVETRNGYFAVPDTGHALTPEEMAGLRALDTQPRPHGFDFLSRAYRFRDSGGHAQYAIAFEMPISNLTATAEQGAHRHRFHASLLALVKNADGVIVDRVSKDVPSEVSDDLFERVHWEFMTYQKAVNLPPAHYTVETAVVDHEGNRASTGTFEIDNRQQRGIGLSDLAVVRKLENLTTPADPADPFEYTGKRVLPFVTSNLLAGTRPFVYFMMYTETGNGAKPVLRVRLLQDGRTIATLRPDVGAPDASGGIPMLLKLTDKPGSYEVRATITQGNSSTERTLQYTLAR